MNRNLLLKDKNLSAMIMMVLSRLKSLQARINFYHRACSSLVSRNEIRRAAGGESSRATTKTTSMSGNERDRDGNRREEDARALRFRMVLCVGYFVQDKLRFPRRRGQTIID